MNKNIRLTFLLFLITSTICFSQEDDNNDFAIWNSIGVKYAPIKKLTFGVEQHLRLKENASQTDEYFTEVQVTYEPFKNIELAHGSRFIRQNDNVGKIQGYEKHYRFNFDLSYNHKIKRFNLFHRIRYQNKRELDLDEDVSEVIKETVRFKTEVGYNIKKWPLDPVFAVEIFSRKRDGYKLISGAKLSRYRLTLGTSYKIKKFGKVGIYYRYQENTRTDNDFVTKVLGLKYSYSIK